ALSTALQNATQETNEAILEAIYPVWLESSPLHDGVKTFITQSLGRGQTAEVFAGFISASGKVRQAVAAKLDDPNEHVRAAAIQAVTNLLPNHPDLRAAVAAKLDDPESNVRGTAIYAVTNLLPDDPDLRAAVAAKLDDPNDNLRATAIYAV